MRDLRQYHAIAWDFDQTLIDHAHSEMFWRYIAQADNQAHYIVTFRTGSLLADLWDDLTNAGSRLLRSHFEGVHAVPDEVYRAFVLGLPAGDRYLYWKGATCRSLGINCLVDDATSHVAPGCRLHGVTHIHPDELSQIR